jgi:hypothetical protein
MPRSMPPTQEQAIRVGNAIYAAAFALTREAGSGYKMHDVPRNVLGCAAIEAVADRSHSDEDSTRIGNVIHTAASAWIEAAGSGYRMHDVPRNVLGRAAIESLCDADPEHAPDKRTEEDAEPGSPAPGG